MDRCNNFDNIGVNCVWEDFFVLLVENCPVTPKDKFKLETAIDDFNLCVLCASEREKNFFCRGRKTFVQREILKHIASSTKATGRQKKSHTKKFKFIQHFPIHFTCERSYQSFIIITRLSLGHSYGCNVTCEVDNLHGCTAIKINFY